MKLRLLGGALLLAANFSIPLSALAAEPIPEPTTLVKVNDFPVTNLHFAIFSAQSKQGDDPQSQIALLNELVNTFMVANSPEAKALEANPEVAAAIEVTKARLLAQAVVNDYLQNAEITEEQIEDRYQSEYQGGSEELKARHILVKTEDEAKAIIKQLDDGADFAELAKEKSTGPSGKVGGDLGWFTSDQMVKPFSEATQALENGKYSETPVQTSFGWHVILREDSREVSPPALDDVRQEITKELRRQLLSEFIGGLRDKTQVEVMKQEDKSEESTATP